MMRKVRRTLAIMLALFLAARAFADYYVSAQADEGGSTGGSQDRIETGTDGFTISSFEVKMNDSPLEDADYVYSGAEIEIALNWTLANEKRVPDGADFSPQEFVIDIGNLDLMGIKLSDIPKEPGEKLYFGQREVGHYYLENGQIHIVIEDETFYQNETNRFGGLSFKGKIEEDEDVTKDGEKKKVGIGDSAVLKDYYLTDTESSVSVNKSLEGDLDAKVVNGETKYYQTYKVTVKAENGTVHKIDLKDIPATPDSLTNPTDVRIVINRAGSDTPEEKTYDSLDAALAAINAINDLYMGESIDIYYTMEVSDHIFDKDVQGYGNEVSGKYTSNRSEDPEDRKDTGKGNAWVTVTKPEISKVGLGYEVRDGKGYVKWKITIKLNDLYDEDITSLQDYIDKVVDIPGNKFVKPAQEELDLSKFTDEGNGVYTYEYELEVTEDVFNSLVNEQVSNKVEVKFKDIEDPYDREGSFTIEHTDNAFIEKKFVEKERVESPEEGLLATWEITVSDIPEGVTGFSITDEARHWNNNPGTQALLTQITLTDSIGHTSVLVVDGIEDSGTGKVLPEGIGIIESVSFGAVGESYGYSTIVFNDEYVEKIAKANGTIKIQIQTLITEDTIGHEYGNGATVSYQDPKTGSKWESAESRDVFRDKENLLTKTGTVIEGKNAIDYTIKVMVPVLEIRESGKHFIITDDLPEGLSVDTSTVTVQLTDQWGNVRVQNSDVTYQCTLAGQKLTVNITATQNLVEQIQGYPYGEPDGYYLVVNFVAAVEDQDTFLEEGETVKFENNASGTYDEGSIGGDTAENEFAPAQMVEKKGEYDADSAPYAKYTVHVNRGGITLLGGSESLTAVDQLGSALTFVDDGNHTVKVYEVYGSNDWDGTRELDNDEYDYEISDDKRTLTFTKLPDGKHLLIEYWAYVDFKNVKTLDETNASNNFVLNGHSSDQAKGGWVFSGDTFIPRGWVDAQVGSITLYKFWTNGNDKEALEGSVFQLWKMRIDDGELVKDDTNGDALIRDEIKITDDNRKEAGKIEIGNLPVNQILALVEIEADEGYSLGAPYYFVVDGTTTIDPEIMKEYNIKAFTSDDTLEYENKPIDHAWIKIAKTWEETDTEMLSWDKIKGSLNFEIKNDQGKTVQTLTGENLNVSVEPDGTTRYVSSEIPVELGTYTVVETNSTIQDFDVETTYVIKSGNDETRGSGGTTGKINLQTADEGVTVVYSNTYNYTGTFTVKVSKRDLTGTDEIAGASFKLSGGSLDSDVFWISGDEPYAGKPYEFELEPGDYILTEIQAPQGFKREMGEIKFTVEKSGEIRITQGSETNKAGDDTVVMRDEPLDVEVRKIAIVEGDAEDVAGAELALYDKDDLDDNYNLQSGHKALHEWTSKAGESEPIENYLYASGDKRTYVLVETKVPENGGYGYSKKIEFKVSETGEIYDVKYVGGNVAGTEGTTKGAAGNRILMEDKAISVKLSKVDLDGENVEGEATISIYKKADIDEATGNPLPNKEAIETFTFENSSGPYKFGSKLLPGEKYVFVETDVPDGYKRADYIEFEVEEDGSVKVYGDVDFDQNRDAYLMYDAKEGEALVSLVIYKTVSGELPLDKIDGSLQFRVQKVSVEGEPYDERFTIAAKFVKDASNGRYVLRLTNLPLGTYKVTEIYEGTTPNDMKLEVSYKIDNGSEQKDLESADIEFTTDGEQHTVTYNNDYRYKEGAIKLTKSLEFLGTALDWNNVAGKLNFHIYKVVNPGGPDERKEEIAGSPILGSLLEWNDTDQVYEFEQSVPVGTYIVEEKYELIDGYVMTTTHTVNAGKDPTAGTVYETSKQAINEGDTLVVGYNNRYVQTHSVAISKKDITNGAELAGVTWKITGEKWDNTSISSIQWTTKVNTTTGKVEPHEVTLEPGEYTLTEITAPTGYKKAAPIRFKLDDNGDITIRSGQTNALDGNTVIMWDDPLDVEVDKVALVGGAEVKGAILYLYDNKGNKLAEHVSDENEVWQIGEYLQLGGTYRLVEEHAPNGYGYSEDIEFTVDDDGNINVVAAVTTQGNKILMEDKAISIKLNKVQLGSTAKELEGAVIGIYYADAVDENGRLKDPNTQPLEAWISETDGYHEFGGGLEAWRDYVFVETVAPDGYQLATSIRFTVNKDGSIDSGSVTTVTGGTVNRTSDGQDTVYLMEDAVYTEPRATLVLTKSIEGEGISSADITKTNLRFHVESVDVSPACDQVFYVGGVGFGWNGDKYVQNIFNLKPGKYKVTELWDDSAASGIVCTGQTWERVLTGASDIDSTSGTSVATGEFSLGNGDTIEVNYTNTYEKGGTLIITKTIAGDIKKEEAENTVKFTVTENSTTKEYTYTLKDDFVYNSVTKQWTKELALVAGGYTVEESVNTSDGKTCTTKYTVTGGTSRNDNGTQVSNVVLEKGGTTTVAYTNTYTANTHGVDNGKDNDSKDNDSKDNDSKDNDSKDNNSKDNDSEDNDSEDNDSKDNNSKDNDSEVSNSEYNDSKVNDGDNSGVSSDDNNGAITLLSEKVSKVATGLTKTGDGAPIGAWLLLLLFGVAEAIDAGYALSHRKKKD